jgi:CBS domain-containing protein
MLVREIMAKPVVTVQRDSDLHAAATTMVERNIGCLVVVDPAGKLAGILTESDLQAREGHAPFSVYLMPRLLGRYLDVEGMERIYAEARTTPVHRLMQPHPVTLPPDASIEQAASTMLQHDIRHVPIVDNGVPVGMVARRDLMRVLAGMPPRGPGDA